MNRYRILEKSDYCKCGATKRRHISKFIVQERYIYYSGGEDVGPEMPRTRFIEHRGYKNLKIFTSLYQAKNFKRSLELKDGIVIE